MRKYVLKHTEMANTLTLLNSLIMRNQINYRNIFVRSVSDPGFPKCGRGQPLRWEQKHMTWQDFC